MRLFAQYVAGGLVTGLAISLMALGLVVVHRSARVLNLAQGMLASLSTFVYWQLAGGWGWPWPAALGATLLFSVALGLGAEAAAIRPLRGRDPQARTVATLGLVLVGQVVIGTVWDYEERFVRPIVTGSVSVAGVTLGGQQILLAAVALAVSVGLGLWFRTSYTGLALSALAEDPASARLLGVRPQRASMLTWALAGALGALAGVLVTPLLVLNSFQMTLLMVASLGAGLIGGFTSLPLAVAGGCAIGVAQSLVAGYSSVSGASDTAGFALVFLLLVVLRRKTSLVDVPRGASWA